MKIDIVCIAVTIILLSSIGYGNTVQKGECLLPVNVAIFIDVTYFKSNYKPRDFRKIKSFIKQLPKFLGMPHSQLGVVEYDELTAYLVAIVNNGRQSSRFMRAIKALPYPLVQYKAEPARIDIAIHLAMSRIFSRHSDLPKVLVMIATGQQTSHKHGYNLKPFLKILSRQNIHTLVLNLSGKNTDAQQLRGFVIEKNSLLTINSKTLPSLTFNITKDICTISAPKTCFHKADIIFLVQTNENLQSKNGIYIKDFIISLAYGLNVGSHGSRAAVIGFREESKLSICFNDTWTIRDFTAAVRDLRDVRRLYGRYSFVRLDRAISLAFKEFTSGHHPQNPGVSKVLLIISDQKHFNSIYARPLYHAIKPLRKTGVAVYGVGVGQSRRDDLKILAEKKENFFFRHSFHALTGLSGKVVKSVCSSIASGHCVKSIDIVFILESSSSSSDRLFHLMKQFIKNFAYKFLLSSYHVQLGVVIFDEKPAFAIKLGQYSTVNGFITRIETMKPTLSTKWRASSAVRLVIEDIISLRSGSRPGVKKIALLFVTSGITSMVRSPLPKSDSLKLIIVAFGSHSTNAALGDLVDEKSELTIVENGNQVDSRALQLSQFICKITDFPVFRNPVDLIFIIDSSRSIGTTNYQKQKDFFKFFLSKLSISPHKTRIGIVVYSYKAYMAVKLSDHYSTNDLMREIDDLHFQRRSARFPEAFKTIAKELMTEENGRRKHVPAVAILFTSELKNLESQPHFIKNFSSFMRTNNLAVVPVTIGHHTKKGSVDTHLAKHLLTAPSFKRLDVILPSMFVEITNIISEPPPCNLPLQLLFVVDSSGSFTKTEFDRVKYFLKTVAITLNIGMNIHIGVVSYGQDASNLDPLGQHNNAFDFSENLDEIVNQPSEKVSLAKALRSVPKAFEEDDSKQMPFKSRKMCVVINKGVQKEPPDSIVEAVKIVISHRIKVLAVVVGGTSNATENLKEVFNNSHGVITTDSIEGLHSLMYPLSKSVCKSEEKDEFENNHCSGLADVAFLVDSSVNYDDYQNQLSFFKRMATRLNVSPIFTRATVIAYSDYGQMLTSLEDTLSYRDFEREVERLPYHKGRQRRLDRALKFVQMSVFSRRGEERNRFAPKVVVAMVAGQHSVSIFDLRSSVKQLDDAGIHVFLVGFRKNIKSKDLQSIAKNPSRVIMIDTWIDVLGSYADNTAASICKVIQPKSCPNPMDAVFLMDSSGSVGHHNFEIEKKTINMLAHTLNMASGAARVAVVSFSTKAQVHLPFRKSILPRQLDENIRSIRYSGFTTYIDLALHTLNNLLFKEKHGSRPYVPRTILLLTDDKQTLYSDYVTLKEPLRELRRRNINLVIVEIGYYKNNPIPLQRAENKDLFKIRNFEGLLPSVYPLSNRLCQLANIQKCPFPVQLTFIVSSSGIISEQTFFDIKEFIKDVSSKITISRLESTANVNIHTATKSIIFNADLFSSNQDFYMAVDGIPYIAEQLQLEESLFSVTGLLTESFGPRSGIKKVLIILVHGLSARSSDPMMLKDTVSPLLGNDVRVVVVGIGSKVNHEILSPLAKTESDVIISKSYQELYWRSGQVSLSICKALDGEPCQDKVFDIGFLIDTSNHVTPSEFMKVKSFVKLVARLFIFETYPTRIAVFLYNSKASLVLKFSSDLNVQSFEKIIDNLPHKGGSSRMDKALNLALVEFRRVDQEEQRNVEKVLVSIINGNLALTLGVSTLVEATTPLLSLGVRSFVVSAKGADRTDRMLSSLLSGQNGRFYAVPTFEQVNSQVASVAKDICEIAEFSPCWTVVDLCFMIDSSGSVSKRNFQRIKGLVKRLVKTFPVSSHDTHVSVITFSDEARLDIKLTDDYDSSSDLERAIDKISYMGYVTRIDKALKLATQEVFSFRGGYRPALPKIAVVFIDGQQTVQSDSVPLWQAVKPLKERGVYIYVVGIGLKLNDWETELLSDWSHHQLMAKSFDDLMAQAKTLSRVICGEDFEGKHKVQK